MPTIVAISGSLRAQSYNTFLLSAVQQAAPSGTTIEIAPIRDIPLYDADVDAASGAPPSVRALKERISAADGLLLASPEYNFSLSAALKNAIDWASRPPNQSWQDKPVAIFSVTPGPLGGARVQYDLRRILGQLWAHVLPRPEVFIGAGPGKFTDGKLTDETTRRFLADLLAGGHTAAEIGEVTEGPPRFEVT